jgi:hypothetical protein
MANQRNTYLTQPDEKLVAACTVETYRASGPGGQHRNKRDSAVRLTHKPTGVVAAATEREPPPGHQTAPEGHRAGSSRKGPHVVRRAADRSGRSCLAAHQPKKHRLPGGRRRDSRPPRSRLREGERHRQASGRLDGVRHEVPLARLRPPGSRQPHPPPMRPQTAALTVAQIPFASHVGFGDFDR